MGLICRTPNIDEEEAIRGFVFATGKAEGRQIPRPIHLSDTSTLSQVQERAGVHLTDFSVPDLVTAARFAIEIHPEHPDVTQVWVGSDAGTMLVRLCPTVDPEGIMSVYLRRQDPPKSKAMHTAYPSYSDRTLSL